MPRLSRGICPRSSGPSSVSGHVVPTFEPEDITVPSVVVDTGISHSLLIAPRMTVGSLKELRSTRLELILSSSQALPFQAARALKSYPSPYQKEMKRLKLAITITILILIVTLCYIIYIYILIIIIV